jgi:DTW domain-containing protein YfiP
MARRPATCDYCIQCRLRAPWCICTDAPRLETATRVVVLIHSSDWCTASNTGHLLRLALRDAQVYRHGRAGARPMPALPPTATSLLLFPVPGVQPLTAEIAKTLPRPVTLFVPDGTWSQARRMMRRLPVLRQASLVTLEEPALGLPFPRDNKIAERRSTFEAVAQALGILDGPGVADRLIAFFTETLRRRRLPTAQARLAVTSTSRHP